MATVADTVPETFEDAARTLAAASAESRAVRISGGGTKPWAGPATPGEDEVRLSTSGLDRILAHDAGDMTATLQAGVRLVDAQRAFAEADQMLALDPPTGAGEAATIGGVVATADCGPLAHRYGGPRDLVVGATVALADGTIARSGGTVIKNVAGYDIAKLLCGSFGTLGLILSVNVRLHPRRPTVSVTGTTADASRLAGAARMLAAIPAELEALDVAWRSGAGRLLARCGGTQAQPRAERVAQAMRDGRLDDVTVDPDDEALWERGRAAQRSERAAVLRVAAPPARLAAVLDAVAAVDGSLVGRVALGHSHVTVDPERVPELRERMPAEATATLRDCPEGARARIEEPWGTPPEPVLALMRALKERFDPAGTCNPRTFVGGI